MEGYDACENSHDFVAEHPDWRVVRGWLMSPGDILDKHLIVENRRTGRRVDVTPIDPRVPFFEHPGTAEEFDGLWHQISMPAYPSPAHPTLGATKDIDRGRSGPVPDEGCGRQSPTTIAEPSTADLTDQPGMISVISLA
jgi:hypothetical protein